MFNFKRIVAGGSLALALALAGPAHAHMLFDNDAGDGDWHNADNWWDTVAEERRLPTSSDNVHLSGNTVAIDASGATYNEFVSSSGGTININSGGELNGTGGTFGVLRHVGGVNVNDGGTFNVGSRASYRANVTVADGGTLNGLGAHTQDNRTLTVNGTWRPADSPWADMRPDFPYTNGQIVFGSTAILELVLLGDDNNRGFRIGDNRSLDLSVLDTIRLLPQGNYEPELGHSYTLWRADGDESVAGEDFTIITGDGSNIVLPGLDPSLSLDVSQLQSDGLVTVVPEPGSLVLLGAGLALIAARRRKQA